MICLVSKPAWNTKWKCHHHPNKHFAMKIWRQKCNKTFAKTPILMTKYITSVIYSKVQCFQKNSNITYPYKDNTQDIRWYPHWVHFVHYANNITIILNKTCTSFNNFLCNTINQTDKTWANNFGIKTNQSCALLWKRHPYQMWSHHFFYFGNNVSFKAILKLNKNNFCNVCF